MEKKTKTEDLQVRPKNVRESDDYSHVVAGRGKNDALRSLLKWGLIDQKISIPPCYPSQPVPKHLKDLRFQESLKRCLKYHRKLRYQSR